MRDKPSAYTLWLCRHRLGLRHACQRPAARGGEQLAVGGDHGAVIPTHDLKVAVTRLDDRRAAFHPITTVEIVDTAEGAIASVVDVSADYAVQASAPGLVGNR